MFIVLLRFSGDGTKASPLVPAHNEWIRRGFDEGVFLLVGSLQPGSDDLQPLVRARQDLNLRPPV